MWAFTPRMMDLCKGNQAVQAIQAVHSDQCRVGDLQSWRLYLPTCRKKYGGSGSGSRGGSSSRRSMGMLVLLPGGAHVRRSSYRLSFRMTRPLMTCRSIARSRQSVSATSR